MSNTEKPDVATVDGNDVDVRLAFADKAEKLLRAILVALGYENAGALRGSDLIAGITAWVTLLITVKHEPGGSYASFWVRTFFDVRKDVSVYDTETSLQSIVHAAEVATTAVNEFAKRYPPMLDDVAIDEESSDTQSDLQSAMVELDKQTQLVWQLESERSALLKANEHHASELATCRVECERLRQVMFDAGAIQAETQRQLTTAIDDNEVQRQLLGTNLQSADYTIKSMSMRIVELESQLVGALVPLAKPERIEQCQRWAFVYEPLDSESARAHPIAMLSNPNWIYLGTDKV